MMLVSYKAIGRNIRAARKKLAVTQEQIAEQLHMSVLHYGRLERGERPASLEQLALIAQTLHVTTAFLLNGCIEGENFVGSLNTESKTLGDAIAEITVGCSQKACELMLALCRTVAFEDKKTESK